MAIHIRQGQTSIARQSKKIKSCFPCSLKHNLSFTAFSGCFRLYLMLLIILALIMMTIADWKGSIDLRREISAKVGQGLEMLCISFAWGMIMSTQFHVEYIACHSDFKNLFYTWFWFRCLNIGIKCLYFSFMLWFHAIYGWLETVC